MKRRVLFLCLMMFCLCLTNGNAIQKDTIDIIIDCFSQGPGEILIDIEGVPATASLATLDYDNDGDTDILVGIRDAGIDPEDGISLYINDRGSFKKYYLYEQKDLVGDVLTVADFNNDGYEDFISGGTEGKIRLFLNNPTITGRPRFDVYEIAEYGQTAWGITSADFNHDNNIDFAVSHAEVPFIYETITIYYNNGDAIFPTIKDIFTFSENHVDSLEAGDYDNDGDTDIIFTYSETLGGAVNVYGITSLLLNDDNNNFGDEILIARRGSGDPSDPDNRIHPGATSSDYDKDGDLDFTISDSSGVVELFVNNGLSNFTSAGIIHDFGSYAWGVASDDCDDDGDIDLLIAAEKDDDAGHGHIYLKHNLLMPMKISKPLQNYFHIFDKILKIRLAQTLILGRITIQVKDQKDLESVKFYINDDLKHVDNESPYGFLWKERRFGESKIRIVAHDEFGNEYTDGITVFKLF